jgi:quercetin dioxygenase-like cupin family protein
VSTAPQSRIVARPAGSIAASDVTLKLWGDPSSGQVNDHIYVSNEKIHQMIFTLPAGGRFGHSERNRTTFGADELYYVLKGTLVLANPETGEVHRAEAGESVFFGPDTWHHGFNVGTEELVVLEYFAPPPATGTSQLYARNQPYLSETRYVQDHLLGRWPADAMDAATKFTQHVIRPADTLWRLEGTEHQILVGLLLSTNELTVGHVDLLPGQRSDPHAHGGDQAGYVVQGRLNLYLPDQLSEGKGNGWFQMVPGDGFFVPAGMPHQYFNMSDSTARFVFGVAPAYLPAV